MGLALNNPKKVDMPLNKEAPKNLCSGQNQSCNEFSEILTEEIILKMVFAQFTEENSWSIVGMNRLWRILKNCLVLIRLSFHQIQLQESS